MIVIDMLSYSVPLVLASIGALFSEYAGALALFMDGLITFSAFLTFSFTVLTGNAFLGCVLSVIISMLCVLLFSFLIEKFGANRFIAAMALNLLFSALASCFSFVGFGTRGVLTSSAFAFIPAVVKAWSVAAGCVMSGAGILFLTRTRLGLYVRITGSDEKALRLNGVSPALCRMLSWQAGALYAAVAGSLLAMRISSFVPNIASGRGWMALAAVFLGKKKPLRIVAAVVIFCCADFFAAYLQNFLSQLPSSFFLSFPYLIIILLVILGN